MQWLHEQGLGQFGTVHLLKAVEGCLRKRYNSAAETAAAVSETIAACQFLVSIGCEVTVNTCRGAATLPSPGVLQWLHESDHCDLIPELCLDACEWHRVDTLRWLRQEVHCPWNGFQIADKAVETGQVDILQLVFSQGEVRGRRI